MTHAGPAMLVNLPIASISTTPFFVMPPGLLALAGYIRQHGEPVALLDLCIKSEAPPVNTEASALRTFEKRFQENGPALVGVSVMVAGQFGLARLVCRCVKEQKPDVVTVIGGAHVSQFPREILEHCPEVDFVVLGEGELQLLALTHFARTGVHPDPWPDGLARRTPDGGIVVSEKQSYLEDVDGLPSPAYDLVRLEDYRHDTSTWHNPYGTDLGIRVPVITSRGCPHGCNFCSVAACMGHRHRPRSPERVADDLQMLHEKHGVQYFTFFDANFAHDPQRVISICHEIQRRNLRIFLDLPTGMPVSSAAGEMIDALAAAGLIRTCISVESGDAYIRNHIMGKNIAEDEIFKLVAAVRRHPQIFLLTDFVLGMPEDTEATVEASCKLIEDMDTDDIALSIATPYPGTKLFQQCVRDNLFMPGIDRSRLWESDWYSHANVDRFTIRPYKLDTDALMAYRDRILALRENKIHSYRERMQKWGAHT